MHKTCLMSAGMPSCVRLAFDDHCEQKSGLWQLQAEEKHDSANASTSGRPFYTDECTAFVRGLPQSVEDSELKAVFADCGDLKEIRITRDPQTGRPKVDAS